MEKRKDTGKGLNEIPASAPPGPYDGFLVKPPQEKE